MEKGLKLISGLLQQHILPNDSAVQSLDLPDGCNDTHDVI